MKYVAPGDHPEDILCFNYSGPSEAVSRITDAVMATGEILPFTTLKGNASWHIDFAGPSLECDHFTGPEADRIRHNILVTSSYGLEWQYYAAWFPNSHGCDRRNHTYGLPFYLGPLWENTTGMYLPAFSEGSLVGENNADLEFYVASMRGLRLFSAESLNFPLLQCRLVNSTYQTSFKFTNGVQEVSTIVVPNDDASTLQAIQQTCLIIEGPECLSPGRTCLYHPAFFQSLSYQAVMDAFARKISGRVYINPSLAWAITSRVVTTVLARTPEMDNIKPYQTGKGASSFQSWIEEVFDDEAEFRGLERKDDSVLNLDLATAISQLFQNVTISLMTSSALQ